MCEHANKGEDEAVKGTQSTGKRPREDSEDAEDSEDD